MRFLVSGSFVALLLTLSGPFATAQERVAARRDVVKWEYAELSYRTLPARPASKDTEGNDVPAREATTSIRWTTGADDLTLNGWEELAEKMSAKFKKDASPVSQRLQVLNALGSAGWELVEQQTTAPAPTLAGGRGNQPGFGDRPNFGAGTPAGRVGMAGTMTFKRRAQ